MTPIDLSTYNIQQEAKAWAVANKLKFVHVRSFEYAPYFIGAKGGCTVAWQREGNSIIKASVALVNPCDCYNKATGRMFSTLKFKAGHWIQLRVPKDKSVSEFINCMFKITKGE
jgi:hypothetical protein